MKKFISFPDIKQFKETVLAIKQHTQYVGKNEQGHALYDETIPLPVIKCEGSVKMHGTNSSVAYNSVDGFWVQSRSNIITIEHDNAGFAYFAECHKGEFLELFDKIAQKYNINTFENTITIFGEWIGKGIQKGMGINQLEKTFVIFAVKISPFDTAINSYWVDENDIKNVDKKIYNINDFKKYEIEIDFNNPKPAYEKMIEMMLEVEKECPVAKALGANGIGEGIVFKFKINGNFYRFKIKGDLHKKSKPKEPKKTDDEKQNRINQCAIAVLPGWRLEQMFNETFDILNGGNPTIEKLGDFLKNLNNDILKEELLTISEFGLEPKEIRSTVSKIAKDWFMERLNENIF